MSDIFSGNYDLPSYPTARQLMVEHQLKRRGIRDTKVLQAMGQIPRHLFIPPEHRFEAYNDHPVSIGLGQTISQPYIVALMTESLHLDKTCSVLEIGTGCGYQTAILASLARQVYTIELLKELSQQARKRLLMLGLNNIQYQLGNGRAGWQQTTPNTSSPVFDRILVAAASDNIPEKLTEQLADKGLMVIPVGIGQQKLLLLKKDKNTIKEKNLCYCSFVKLK